MNNTVRHSSNKDYRAMRRMVALINAIIVAYLGIMVIGGAFQYRELQDDKEYWAEAYKTARTIEAAEEADTYLAQIEHDMDTHPNIMVRYYHNTTSETGVARVQKWAFTISSGLLGGIAIWYIVGTAVVARKRRVRRAKLVAKRHHSHKPYYPTY